MTMFTDPERIRRKDPGRPDVCNLFQFHKLFSNEETIAASITSAAPRRSAASTTRSCSPRS